MRRYAPLARELNKCRFVPLKQLPFHGNSKNSVIKTSTHEVPKVPPCFLINNAPLHKMIREVSIVAFKQQNTK